MIIQKNKTCKLPVILIDDSDFKTELINVTSVTLRYRNPGTGWLSSSGAWSQLGNGLYIILFPATEIGTTIGQFLYYCKGSTASPPKTSLPFWGSAQIISQPLDVISLLDFLFFTLAGHGLHVLAKNSTDFLTSASRAQVAWANLPTEYKQYAVRCLSFFKNTFGPNRIKKPPT